MAGAVKSTLPGAHTADGLVTSKVGPGVTVTVVVAVLTQPIELVAVNVYVVVVVGFTVGFSVVELVISAVGDQLNEGVVGLLKLRLQLEIVPTSEPALSPTCRDQVPFAVPQPAVTERNAFHAAVPPEGTNVPLNGAVPLLMPVVAEGVKAVLLKLSPLPPVLLISWMLFPQGS